MHRHQYPQRAMRLVMVLVLSVGLCTNGFIYSPTRVSAINGEDSLELALLKTYTSYYRSGITPGHQTLYRDWRNYTWNMPVHTDYVQTCRGVNIANNYCGNGVYYRTVCATVAVAAVVRQKYPDDTEVISDTDWSRLRAMLISATVESDTWPASTRTGQGWAQGNPDPYSGGLWFDSGFVGYTCTLAAALLWKVPGVLSSADRLLIREKLRAVVQNLYDYRNTNVYTIWQVCHDSQAELASGDAAFLAAMSQFDRYDTRADRWLAKAQDNMKWAYDHLNSVDNNNGCHPGRNFQAQWTDTVTNHDIFVHPVYTLSIVNDTAAALLPWIAQGVKIQDESSGMYDIVAITNTHNLKFLGTDVSFKPVNIGRPIQVYNAALSYLRELQSLSPPLVSDSSDWTFTGTVYKANFWSIKQAIQDKCYLGRCGVLDWGFGAEFQNAAGALPSFMNYTMQLSATSTLNYYKLLTWELKPTTRNASYLPPIPAAAWDCSNDAFTSQSQWHNDPERDFLPATCNAGIPFPVLLPYFDGGGATSVGQQINTHFFLNSLKALNHLIAYFYMADASDPSSAYWPKPRSLGNSNLPDFNNTQIIQNLWCPVIMSDCW